MLAGEGGGESPDVAALTQGGEGDDRPPVGFRAGRRGRGDVLEDVAYDVLPGPLRPPVLHAEICGQPRSVAVALDRLGGELLGELRGGERITAGTDAQLGREDLLEGRGAAAGRLGLRSRTAAGLAEHFPVRPRSKSCSSPTRKAWIMRPVGPSTSPTESGK